MLDRTPAGDSTDSLYDRIETATDALFFKAEASLRRSARALLLGLILFSVTASVLFCLIFGEAGVNVWGFRTQSERMISPAQATETYGAQQFYIQLTAQAAEKVRQLSP